MACRTEMRLTRWTISVKGKMYWSLIFLSIMAGIWGDIDSHLRLPDNLLPKKYTIEIVTDLREKKFNFEGEETIEMECTKSTNKIILHSKDLEIVKSDVSIKQQYKGHKTATGIIYQRYDKQNDNYLITLASDLVQRHVYFLFIRFKGNLNTDQVGYCRTAYYDSIKKKHVWLAVTQMGEIDARRVFPCFDQPDMKAEFQISIGHQKELKAISNMPMTRSKPMMNKPDWVLDQFENSPPMSTYLVAFMVSDFQFKTTETQDSKTTVRIWSQTELLGYVDFAMDIVPKLISFYEKMFRRPFPLPKLDLVAIPDFNRDKKAKETWGLSTFKSNWLLNHTRSDGLDEYSAGLLINTIVAYQWVGNLVTMKWWPDFWLTDGIVYHVAMEGVHHLFPEKILFEDETINIFINLMKVDQTELFRSLSTPREQSSDIKKSKYNSFNDVESASLIRMIHMALGEDVFKESISAFLNKYKYSSAIPVDFWTTLTGIAHAKNILQTNLTVQMIIDSWVKQKGYPLLTITRDYNHKTVTITQQRYIFKIQKGRKLPQCDSYWWVPLTFTNGKELHYNYTKPEAWLNSQGPLKIDVSVESDEWLLFNLKATGSFRVNYDQTNWYLLLNTLHHKQKYKDVNILNRYQIIADSVQFAESGFIDYETFFNLISYVKHETEYQPWQFVLMRLGSINFKLIRTAIYKHFKEYMQDLLQPMFKAIGNIATIPANDEQCHMHSLITRMSHYYGIEECSYQAKQLFDQWFLQNDPDRNNPIPNLIRDAVYCYGVESGGKKTWDFMWRRYEKVNETLKKQQILCALGCTKDKSLLKRLLEMSLDSSKVNQENSQVVFQVVARNEIGYLEAKDFFMDKFKRIVDSACEKEKSNKSIRLPNFAKFFHSGKSRSSMLMENQETYMTILAKGIISEEELHEFQTFASSMSSYLINSKESFKESFVIATNNIQWHSAHYDDVAQYFLSNWV